MCPTSPCWSRLSTSVLIWFLLKLETFACTFSKPILWEQLIRQIFVHVNFFPSYYRPSRKSRNLANVAEPVILSKNKNFLMNISGFTVLIQKAIVLMLYVSLHLRTFTTYTKFKLIFARLLKVPTDWLKRRPYRVHTPIKSCQVTPDSKAQHF